MKKGGFAKVQASIWNEYPTKGIIIAQLKQNSKSKKFGFNTIGVRARNFHYVVRQNTTLGF